MKKADFRQKQQNEAVVKATAEATRARSADSFQNLTAQVGLGTGNLTDGGTYGFGFQSRNRIQMEAAYRSSWICGLAVDVIAEDMTRAGIDLQSDDMPPDDADKMHKAFDRLCLWNQLSDTIKWSRLYGGAIAVLLVDGQNPKSPLNIESVKKDQFKGLLVLDRWQINPSLNDIVEEYGPDLGQPKFYTVQANAAAMRGQVVHYSRVIRLEGQRLPYQQKVTENGWGQSVLERLWDRLTAFDSTTDGAAQLVFKAHLRTIKIKGLRAIVGQQGQALKGLTAQVEMMRAMQRNEGITMMDSEDEFDAHSYSFAGLDNILMQFGQQIAGATQIPLVRLFGQSPAGMNSTGESDLRTYYDNISQQQNSALRQALGTRLLPVLARSELGRNLPDGFGFEFVSLWQMTNEQKSTVTKNITDSIIAAEGAALISPQVALRELRQLSRTTGVFTHIGDDDIEKADTDPPEPEPDLAPAPGAPAAGAPKNDNSPR